ncbi:hypothetical protein B0H34DRAFT_811912 [Crassisporium funariophilum]|nr:hypothetical protein B0H34DRAFT_811912 [Crassisporium funariophilum]
MASVRIDDQSTSIVYSQPASGVHWGTFGDPREYMNTTRLTRDKGATATFSFVGSSVAVYGTIGSNDFPAAVSSYSIDGGPSKTYTARATTIKIFTELFFQSATLGAGQHTLVITNEIQDDFYWLDFLLITPVIDTVVNPPAAPPPVITTAANNGTSVTTVGTGLPNPSSTTPLPSSTETPKPTNVSNNQANSETKPNDMAAIVGGALGGVILIGVLIAILLCLRRRRKGIRRAHDLLDKHIPETTNSRWNRRGHADESKDLYNLTPSSPARSPQGSDVTSSANLITPFHIATYTPPPPGLAKQPLNPTRRQPSTASSSSHHHSETNDHHGAYAGFVDEKRTMAAVPRAGSSANGLGRTNRAYPDNAYDQPPPAY